MPDEQIDASQDPRNTGAESPADTPSAPPVVTRTRGSRTRKAAEPAPETAPETAAPMEDPEAPEVPAKRAAAKRAPAKKAPVKKAAAKRAPAKKAAPEDAPLEVEAGTEVGAAEAAPAPTVTRTTRTRGARKTASTAAPAEAVPESAPVEPESAQAPAAATMPLFKTPETGAPAKRATTRRTRKSVVVPAEGADPIEQPGEPTAPTDEADDAPAAKPALKRSARKTTKKAAATKAVAGDEDAEADRDADVAPTTEGTDLAPAPASTAGSDASETDSDTDDTDTDDSDSDESEGGGRRRRRRGGRRRRRSGEGADADQQDDDDAPDGSAGDGSSAGPDDEQDGNGDGSSRRRRRRRRSSDSSADASDDPDNTVTRVRRPRNAEDEITSLAGSTRLEAKKQRRREGREAGRRRAPIVSEAEFLARRESVERTMVIRQRDELTQIGVLEDKVLVEHYVARESQTSLIGNVYLGRVQNVLPSMEAAFIDIGKGRNAVLYAGEVNWSALGHREGQPRKMESVLSSGQPVLVQVTKDPIGQKGARLSSQISLAGRFLVYVPDGTTSGISRKLPDTERNRLKTLLKQIVPESAGVIVRTAAEGASEAELTQDVERLKARWEDIEAKSRGNAPQLLYGEPDLTLKVVRDLFTEDFAKLVIQGPDAWETVQGYVQHVAPDLEPRLERYEPSEHSGKDLFATYRVDEQIAKGLDRKVWLPSGGSLVIDRTEAMTVVDVNTGKFTGSGGNLEETVTKNNLESAEEIVRQLRLRDIGGIIVVDFIDMVLESNRDLVLRRLVECLGRDRTRHQVAEVTSLGLVQMTRKRIGTGLLEAFGENCQACHGRGVIVHDHPVEQQGGDDDNRRGGGAAGAPGGARRGRGGRGRGSEDVSDGSGSGNGNGGNGNGQRAGTPQAPSPRDIAAIARPENAEAVPLDERTDEVVQDAVQAAVAEQPAVPVAQPPAVPVVEEVGARFPDEQPEQPAVEPEQPRVVTRTRRRSATRPAGPPQGAVGTVVSLDPEAAAAPGGGAEVVDGGEPPVVEHVPVKRRGARKR